MNVAGSLSASDYARFLSVINNIEPGTACEEVDVLWDGALFEGPITSPKPRIVLKSPTRGTQPSPTESQFLVIVDILTPYLSGFYAALA